MTDYYYFSAFFTFALMLFPGCSGTPNDQPKTAPVTGIVTIDGKPIEFAVVVFRPDEGRPSIDETDKDGFYRLTYNARTKGAMLGHHSVSITTARGVDLADPNSKARDEILPKKYFADPSPLEAVVKEGKNEINFELDTKE